MSLLVSCEASVAFALPILANSVIGAVVGTQANFRTIVTKEVSMTFANPAWVADTIERAIRRACVSARFPIEWRFTRALARHIAHPVPRAVMWASDLAKHASKSRIAHACAVVALSVFRTIVLAHHEVANKSSPTVIAFALVLR